MSIPVRTLLTAACVIAALPVAAGDAAPTSGKPAWLSLAGGVGLGWDSNILLEPDVNPSSSDSSGSALSADIKVGFRVWNRPDQGERITVAVDGGVAHYPGNDEADLARLGATLSGTTRVHGLDLGLYSGAHRYWLDGDEVANAYGLNPYAAKVWARNVSVVTLGATWLDYPNDDGRSGLLVSLEYRHWFLLAPRVITRRIEVGLRGVHYGADDSAETFTGLVPFLGAFYRIGAGQRPGTVDLAARLSYEWRDYSEADDTQGIATAGGSADLWVCREAALGLYASLTQRRSDVSANEYDRTQIGARATVQW